MRMHCSMQLQHTSRCSTALLLSLVNASLGRPGPSPGALCCTTFVLVSFADHSFYLLLMSSDAIYWDLTELSRSRASVCCVPGGCLPVLEPCFAEIPNHIQDRCSVYLLTHAGLRAYVLELVTGDNSLSASRATRQRIMQRF